jgi:hypothetical protein
MVRSHPLLPPCLPDYCEDSPNYIADHEWRKKTAFASALKKRAMFLVFLLYHALTSH